MDNKIMTYQLNLLDKSQLLQASLLYLNKSTATIEGSFSSVQ